MIREEITVVPTGRLQSRAAALLVQEACKYTSRILIEQGSKTINAKSMMGVLSLGIPSQNTMLLIAEGADEAKAAAAIKPLVRSMFTQD